MTTMTTLWIQCEYKVTYNNYNDYKDHKDCSDCSDYNDYNDGNNYNGYRDSDLDLDRKWFSDLVT